MVRSPRALLRKAIVVRGLITDRGVIQPVGRDAIACASQQLDFRTAEAVFAGPDRQSPKQLVLGGGQVSQAVARESLRSWSCQRRALIGYSVLRERIIGRLEYGRIDPAGKTTALMVIVRPDLSRN